MLLRLPFYRSSLASSSDSLELDNLSDAAAFQDVWSHRTADGHRQPGRPTDSGPAVAVQNSVQSYVQVVTDLHFCLACR